jgi:hypothetical protein
MYCVKEHLVEKGSVETGKKNIHNDMIFISGIGPSELEHLG